MRDRIVFKTISVSLPFGIGSISWDVDPTERKAAWPLDVEGVAKVLAIIASVGE